ncbi:hypothetical protein C8F01DRAFT_99272 [Mycena amicta]|nr:hypothetical protein C8F01DRAFT_99272 [Mycena amicta]
MHASLKLSSLAQLPATLKASALAAARGSLRDFDSFVRCIADPGFKKSYFPRLICVLYAALDPTPISTFLADEFPSAADKDAFADSVARALRAIHSLDLWIEQLEPHQTPPAVFRDLWPRMWAWIQFHDTFCDSGLVAFPDTSTINYYLGLGAVAKVAYESTLLARQILDTPHFFDFLGKVWVRLVEGPSELLSLECRMTGLAELSELIYTARDSLEHGHGLFEELCSGAGGRASIARSCIGTIKLFFPNTSAPYTWEMFNMLKGVLCFLALPRTTRDPLLLKALDRENFPTHLTIAVRALLSHHDDLHPIEEQKSMIIHACFHVLSAGLIGGSAYRPQPLDASFIEALKAGYLCATYSYLRHALPETSVDFPSVDFLERLKRNTIYYLTSRNVLLQLRQDKAELINVVETSHFRNSKAAEMWNDLLAFIRARVERFEEYREQNNILLHGCDNFACGRLHEKTDMSRCSLCSQVQYCSRGCQRDDWRQRHREHCPRSARVGSGGGRQRRLRVDATFMRWLMNTEYSAQEETIALLLLRFFALHRSDGALPCILFDWIRGSELGRVSRVTVEPLTKTPALEERYGEDIDRARSSQGKFQLHFFVVAMDPKNWILCPMYSTSSLVYEGLEAIAARIPADEAQDMDMELYRNEIRELLRLEVSTGGPKTH